MCGIVGLASAFSPVERGWLALGAAALAHRGPDGADEWWSTDGAVGLAHRRLAIIDLSPAAAQPMRDAKDELCIVFNGEIYNFSELRAELAAKGHSFRSASDTEVILAAYREWDMGCLARLNGMFALALYDRRRRRLFLARDRAGEKPLYYSIRDGVLAFASELKGLLADPVSPRRIDRESLDCYLAMGYVPGDRCILQGIRKLPPAHALAFELERGSTRVWRYWSLPYASPARAHEAELVEELEGLLADSVRRQLVSDVPLGVLLSGGVDSSLVTAMAARAAPQLRTFTVRFPGHGSYDETAHARLVARHFGTEHVELDAAECAVELLPRLARQFDEPVADSSMIPTHLVSRLVRAHCTVGLGGDGGDELFGGYAHYDRLLWVQRNLGWIPRCARRGASSAAAVLLPVGFKGRNWLQGLEADLDEGLPHIASVFDRSLRRRLLPGGALVAEEIQALRLPRRGDLLERATRYDFDNYLPEDILVKIDRASMFNSLEVRAPFLDHRLIEFAFGKVPSALKATPRARKILLKKLATRVLPAGFDLERKQGFSIPLASWLRAGTWRQFFRETLAAQQLFHAAVVRELLDGQDRGRSNSERLFALVMLELWRREYGVAV